MKIVLLILMMWAILVPAAQSTPTAEAIAVLEGILVGAFGDVGHEVKECMQDGQAIFEDFEQAVAYFEKGGLHNVEEGLKMIGAALEKIPEEIKYCKEVTVVITDIEKLVKEFANPVELVVKVAEEIIWHGRSIYRDVKDCVDNFHGHKYYNAGENIGNIIKLIFLKLRDPVIDAESFLEGFFRGALEDDSIEINHCIDDATVIIEELELIIGDFKKGTEDYEKLFLDFIDLISESVASVVQCEKIPPEVSIMQQWEEEMKDMSLMEKKMFFAFLYYPDRIKEDMKDMFDTYDAHQFNTTGFCMGDFLHILFVDVKTVKDDVLDDAIEFMIGFYDAAFKIELNMSTCEADVEAEFALVQKAISELEHLSYEDIKHGVEDLMHTIPLFLNAFDACKEDWPQIQQGLDKLDEFVQKPDEIPWAVSKAMGEHPFRVESDCSTVYHAFNDSPHNFHKGGEGSGDLTELLLSELKAYEDTVLVQELI